MSAPAVELVGPKGFEHGWIYKGPRGAHAGDLTPEHHAILHGRSAKTARQHRNAAAEYGRISKGSTGATASRAARLARFHRARARALEGQAGVGTMAEPTELAAHQPIDPKIKLGSGGRFKKMKAKLAARGARDPGALAAYIGRRAYGAKKFGALSHGHANTTPALEFAMPSTRLLPVSSPYDLVISRSDDGQAVIRHRRGGGEIARIRHDDTGWVAAVGGKDTPPHTRQRGALLEAIGTHNKSASSPYHRAAPEGGGERLQAQPEPTALMTAYGISNIRSLAASTPVVGAGDGPRSTSRDGGGPTAGLGAKGSGIYAKLRKRNFPHARAHAFAKRAERMSARRGGK